MSVDLITIFLQCQIIFEWRPNNCRSLELSVGKDRKIRWISWSAKRETGSSSCPDLQRLSKRHCRCCLLFPHRGWSHLVLTCLATKSKSKKRVTHFRPIVGEEKKTFYTKTHRLKINDGIFIKNKCW